MNRHSNFTRLMSLLLSLILMAGLTTGAWAVDVTPKTEQPLTGYMENPMYQVHVPISVDPEDAQIGLAANPSYSDFVSTEKAIGQIRDSMEARKTVFSVYVRSNYAPDWGAMIEAAFSEEYAVSPTTGDYLKWSWSSASWSYGSYSYGWGCTIEMSYYDNASQEAQFKKQLNALVNSLDLWECSTYLRIEAIYDYITSHVTYDYAGLSTFDDDYDAYDPDYGWYTVDPYNNNNYLIYTAYAALCNGTSVCQGYATLLYALCRSYDVPVRVITSVDHAWNIAQIGKYYYNLDSTWDSDTYSGRDYFLIGSRDFKNHPPEDEYLTSDFRQAYPISYYTYAPTAADYQPVLPFRDVKEGKYYYQPVVWAVENGITSGMTKNTFEPDSTCTRGQVVTFLWRAAGCPEPRNSRNPFSDVQAGKYYYKAVLWAVEKGITSGVTSTTFCPNDPCTRGQVVTFQWRAAGQPGSDFYGNPFVDVPDGKFYTYAVLWAVNAGITNGITPTTFEPNKTCTRGQIVTFLYRQYA